MPPRIELQIQSSIETFNSFSNLHNARLPNRLTAGNYRAARSVFGECAVEAIGPESCQLKRRSAVTVQAMGYFWIGTSKLDEWVSLATGQLGR